MRISCLLFCCGLVCGQALSRPDPVNLRPPAISGDGRRIFFASAIRPDARQDDATNLWTWLLNPSGAVVSRLTQIDSDPPYAGVTSVAYAGNSEVAAYLSMPNGPGSTEEVHVFNLTTQNDRIIASDSEGCVQPLCVNCFFACLRSAHLSGDSSKVLYDVARERPFYVANADGTGKLRLNTYSGLLAPSPQRVITQGGLVVFTSAAPFGPTFAPAATDVYLMNLDGSNVRNVTNFTNVQFAASSAVIARDGSRLAFLSNYAPSGPRPITHVWTVRADGSDLRQLSTGDQAAASPSISADGSLVTYVQNGQVYRISTALDPAAFIAPIQLTSLAQSRAFDAVISDDGAFAAFSMGPTFGTAAAVYRAATNANTPFRDLAPVFRPRMLIENTAAGASGSGKASPGSLITMYGLNIGITEFTQAQAFPLPRQLGDVELLLNGQPIPLHAVTSWQINAHLPQTAIPGTGRFEVRYSGEATTTAVSSPIVERSPENFAVAGANFPPAAAAFHGATSALVTAQNPATAGEVIAIYGIGFGRTSPQVEAGVATPISPLAHALTTPRLMIGNREAQVMFAGLVPGFAGVYQANVMVPSGLSAGSHALSWIQPDGTTSAQTVLFVR